MHPETDAEAMLNLATKVLLMTAWSAGAASGLPSLYPPYAAGPAPWV
jgi:hypothetical protein